MSINSSGKAAATAAPGRRSSLQNFIIGWLSRYVDGLQDGQARIEHDLWNGEMTIMNAKLNTAALSKYMRAANLTEGSVGRIRIKIPWSTLLSASTTVEVEKVRIELSSLGFAERLEKAGGSLEALRATLLRDKRELIENLVRAMELKRQLDSEEVGSFTGTLLTAMINSIQISIKDICISFRVSDSVITISLGGASVLSCNKEWKVGEEAAVTGEWYKRCELSGLSIDVGESPRMPLQAEPLDATLLISSTQQNRAMHWSLTVNGGRVTIDRERANILLKANRTLHAEGKLVRQALSSDIKESDKDVLKAEYQALLVKASKESARIDNIEALVPAMDLARWRYERGLRLKEDAEKEKAQVTSWFASWAGKEEVDKVVGNAAKGAGSSGKKMQRSVTWTFELTNVTVDCLQHQRDDDTPSALTFGLGRLFFNVVVPNLSSPQELAVDGGVDDVQVEAYGKHLLSFDSRPDGPSVEISFTRSKPRGRGILDPYEATVSITSDALVAWIEPTTLKKFAASGAQFATEYKEAKISAITEIQERASQLDMTDLTDLLQSASQHVATKLVHLKVDMMAPIVHIKPAEMADELTCILGRVQVTSKDGEEYRLSMSDNSVVIAGAFGCTQFLDPSEVHVVLKRAPLHVEVSVASTLCVRLTPACLRFVNGTLATVRDLVKEIVGSLKDMRKGIREAVQKARQLQAPSPMALPDFGLSLVLDAARLEVCADGQCPDGLVVEVKKVSLALADSEWKGACSSFEVHTEDVEDTCGGCITLQGESSSEAAVGLTYKGGSLDVHSGYLLSDITPGFLKSIAKMSRELSAEVEVVDPEDAREATKTMMEASDALFSEEGGEQERMEVPEVELERVKLGLLDFARRHGGKLELPRMDGERTVVEISVDSKGSCLSLFDSEDTKDRRKAIVVGRIADLKNSIKVSRCVKDKLAVSGELTVRSISLEVAGKEIISPCTQSVPSAAEGMAPFVSILWGLYPSPWPYQSAVIAQTQQLRIRPLLVDLKSIESLGRAYKEATTPEKAAAPPIEHFINRIDDLGAAIAESTSVARLPCLIALRAAAPVLELAVVEKEEAHDVGPTDVVVDLMDLDAQEQSSEESFEGGDHVLVNLGVVTLDSKMEDASTVRIDASVNNVHASAFCLPPPRSPVSSNGQGSQDDLLLSSEQETDVEPALTEEVILPSGSAALSVSLPLSWEVVEEEADFSKLIAVEATVQDEISVTITPEALRVLRQIGKTVRAAFAGSDLAVPDVDEEKRVLAGIHKLATKRKRADVQVRAGLGKVSLCLVTHEGAHPLEVSFKSMALTASRRDMMAEVHVGEATARVASYTFIKVTSNTEGDAGLNFSLALTDSPTVRVVGQQSIDISLSSAVEEGLRTVSKACSLSNVTETRRYVSSRLLGYLPDADLQLGNISITLFGCDGSSVRVGLDVDARVSKQEMVEGSDQTDDNEVFPTIVNLASAVKIRSLTSAASSNGATGPRRLLKNREGTLVTIEGKIVSIPGEKLSVLLDTVRFENSLALSLAGPDVMSIRKILRDLRKGIKSSSRPSSRRVLEASVAVFFAPGAHVLVELVYCSTSGLSRPALRIRVGTKLLSIYYQQGARLTAGSARQPPVFKILAADVTTRASVINYKMGEWEPLLLPLTTNVEIQRMSDQEDPEGRIVRVDMRASPEASSSDLIVSPLCLGVLNELLPQFSSKQDFTASRSHPVDEDNNDALLVVNLTDGALVLSGDTGVKETIQPGPKHIGIDHLFSGATMDEVLVGGDSPGTAQLLHETELSVANNGNWQAEVVALSPIRKLLVFSGPVRIANMTRIPLRVYMQAHVSDTGEAVVVTPSSLTTSLGDVVCDQEGYFLLEPRAFIGVPSSIFHAGGGFSIQPDDGNWERSEPLPCTFNIGGSTPRTRRLKMSCRKFSNPDELMYVNCQYSPVHGSDNASSSSSSGEEESASERQQQTSVVCAASRMISLLPIALVTNECPMYVEVEANTASQARDPHVLHLGPSGSGSIPIFDIDASYVKVRVPGSSSRGTHWSRPIFIDDEADLNVVQTIDLPVVNGAGLSVNISVVVTSDPDGCQQLTLFSKNWFVNSVEGVDIYPMQTTVNDLVRSPSLASDKDLYHMAPIEDRKKGGLSLTVGFVDNQAQQLQGGQWRRVLVPLSSRDSCEVELGGSSVVLQADVVEKQQIEDDAGSLMPSSGVMIPTPESLPLNLVRSTVITAIPGIIMFNRTGKCLKVSQGDAKGVLLGPMENSPVHWSDLRRDRFLQVVYADPSSGESSGWLPTGPIIPRASHTGAYSMIMRNELTLEVAVLTVEVVVNRGVVNVAVYEAADDNKENQKSSLQVCNDKCYHLESILVCPEDDPTQSSFTHIPADSTKSVGFCDPFRTKHYLLVRVEFERNISSLYRIDVDDCPSSMPITRKGFPATILQILPSPSCEGGVLVRLRPYNPSLHLAAFDKTGEHAVEDSADEVDTAWSFKLQLGEFGVRVFGPGSKARRLRRAREDLFYCGVSKTSIIASCGVEGGSDHSDTLVLRSFRVAGLRLEHVPRNLLILSSGRHSRAAPGLGMSGIWLNARRGRDMNLRDVCVTVPPLSLTLDTRALDDLTALTGAFIASLGSGPGLSSLTITSAAARAGVPYHYLCTTPAPLGRVLKLQRLTISQLSLKLWCSFNIEDSQFLPDDIKFLLSLLTLGDTLDLKGPELVLPQQAFYMYQPYRGPTSGLSKVLSDEYKKVIVANMSQVVGSSSVLNVIGAKLWGPGFAGGSADSDEEKKRMFAGGNGTCDSRHGVQLRADGVLKWEDVSLDESKL